MIRLAPLPFQQQQGNKSLSLRRRRTTSSWRAIVVGFLLCCVVSVYSEGPHCNQVGHGPQDMIMASGRINPKYTWYKRGKKTYVPVVMDPTYSHKEHSTIVGGLHEIQEKTCVEFEFYEDEHSLHGKDYVYITRQTKRGCWSYIGRIHRGKQEIGLPPGCITHRTAMHEMMHALGFRHEHVRHDRDDYIIIFWGNIKQGRETNFQRRSNDISVGPYDYNSIMHYDRKAFSKNNMDTILPLKNGVKIGVRQKMSHWDAKKINIMYSCHAGGGGGGGGGHLSWSPEHDHEDDGLDSHLIDDGLSSIHPAQPRNASSSPPSSSEIEVAYDELDYDPSSESDGRSLEPHQRSGRTYGSFDNDEFIGSDRHDDHHPGRRRGRQQQDHYGHHQDHDQDDDRGHPHSGHDPPHHGPYNEHHQHPNSDYNSPQSYSHFEQDSYPHSDGGHGGSSNEGSPPDDSVDFYDV